MFARFFCLFFDVADVVLSLVLQPLLAGFSVAILDNTHFLLASQYGVSVVRFTATTACGKFEQWTKEYTKPDIMSQPPIAGIERGDDFISAVVCSGHYTHRVVFSSGVISVFATRAVSQFGPTRRRLNNLACGFGVGVCRPVARAIHTRNESFVVFPLRKATPDSVSFFHRYQRGSIKMRLPLSQYVLPNTLYVDERQGRLVFVVRDALTTALPIAHIVVLSIAQ